MTTDPRLENIALLTLAAFRVQQRRQTTGWEHTVGLAALLDAARALPPPGPWDLPDLEPRDGLAGLLAEARQWQEAREGGT